MRKIAERLSIALAKAEIFNSEKKSELLLAIGHAVLELLWDKIDREEKKR